MECALATIPIGLRSDLEAFSEPSKASCGIRQKLVQLRILGK